MTGKYGTPALLGAPYDLIGDTMRCTTGIMKDLYRRPDKAPAAVEALTPASIQMGAQMAMTTLIRQI